MDAAEAQAVRDARCPERVHVGEDVSCVEEPQLLEPANSAPVAIRGQDKSAEACLMEANPRLSHGITLFDHVDEWNRFALVERSDHLARRDAYAPFGGKILL